MYAYVQPASPWLSEPIKSYIRKHAPNTKFIDNFDHFPTNAKTVFQFCDGWALNRNFLALNSATTGLINAYPNSDALARKDYLARVVELWTAKRPESILKSHVPATVRLSLDYAEYVEESLTAADDLSLLYSLEANESKPPAERDWWIMKPALVDCGAGIRLFSTIDELANHLELAEYEVEGEDERESMRDFWDAPDDLLPGDWKAHVFQQVCAVSAELFQAAAHTMADKFTTVNKCFELFAVDFLIDSGGTAWLLEVNETPAFYNVGIAGPLALRLMESVICVTTEHMGMAQPKDHDHTAAKERLIQVLDETEKLAKSNITEILPES
ncbi:uncharacterized protein N0V96_007450 [Colletotrichum fioriniae]|uniref:uncharacterized protein n=1 Tax=Colletotrichum fioriniae TaxID=710243 RepID=UPI0032D9ED8B|nr:hypothetical protein N0V96_007450 [Colletotrichum fioriniae]